MSDVMNDAQQKLVEDNLKLVYHVLNRYFPTVKIDDDITSAGTLGLCNAALTWDESKSTFCTYACKCIQNEINKELKLRSRRYSVITNSLDEPVDKYNTLGDVIPYDEDTLNVDYSFLLLLSPDERVVYDLRSKDYDVGEIVEITGFDRRKVRRLMRTGKAKYHKVNG